MVGYYKARPIKDFPLRVVREEAAITLRHEWMHILLYTGRHVHHDEEAIDFLAKNLANACPEILELCGVNHRYRREPKNYTQLVLGI